MIPCRFLTLMIHPPWVYQEPETPWISSEQNTPAIIPQQVPSPPIQVSPSREESNMSTGDLITPPPPRFDETPPSPSTPTKLHRRHHLRSPRSTRLHHSKLHRPQKPRPLDLWQSFGDLAHFISSIQSRSVGDPIRCTLRLLFRPQRLHSFGGHAGVLRALRPFRRLRDKQPDSSGSACETTSVGSSSGDVNSFGERL